NQLFFSLALTNSEISRRSPEGETVADLTVTATGALPSSGNVRPFNCALMILFTSVKGRSIGTPTFTLPLSSGGTICRAAGNGQSGLVEDGVTRVCASMPS